MADWYFRNYQGGAGLRSCPGCRNLVRQDEEFCPYCARRLRAPGGVRGLLGKLRRVPFLATKTLLGLIALGFLLQMLSDALLPAQLRDSKGMGLFSLLVSNSATYIRLGSNFFPFVQSYHEYWRFLSYCFLHFGLIHILFNSWAFWDLGRLAEGFWGARQVFATFILTGICGGAVSFGWNYLITGGFPTANSAGASGAICGVLGLLIGAYYRSRYHIGEHLGPQLVKWALMILVLGLVARFDNAAHVGGLVSGAALGYFLPPKRDGEGYRRQLKIWNALAVLSLVLLVATVVCVAVYCAQGTEFLNQRYLEMKPPHW